MADATTTQIDATVLSAPYSLHVLTGALVVPLVTDAALTLGRGSDVDVAIPDPSVSRRHARMWVESASLHLEDLGSSAGTWIGDQRIPPGEPSSLTIPAMFRLGNACLAVVPGSRNTIDQVTVAELERRLHQAVAVATVLGHEAIRLRLVYASDVSDEAVSAWMIDQLDNATAWARIDSRVVDVVVRHASWTKLARIREGGQPEHPQIHIVAQPRAPIPNDAAPPLDPAMLALYEQARLIARGTLGVLITGETGVGKELLARELHRASGRRADRYVRLNCASLTESLLEAELFGHERGAFTGAGEARPGLFEQANGGTLLLDEIGELSPIAQAKLLRALEESEVRRVGGTTPRPIDVRFVSATNRALSVEVANGRFRQDLYYRLAGSTLHIPPLRTRRCEILPLAERFVRATLGRSSPLDSTARAALLGYDWPGNIRELRGTIERAVLLACGRTIGIEHLPPHVVTTAGRVVTHAATEDPMTDSERATVPIMPNAATRRGRFTRDEIVNALAATGGNQSRAAELLGISRRTLANRMIGLGLRRPRRP